MNLIYKNNKIPVTYTINKGIMRYKFQKLYYAIIINECNKYICIEVSNGLENENFRFISSGDKDHNITNFFKSIQDKYKHLSRHKYN